MKKYLLMVPFVIGSLGCSYSSLAKSGGLNDMQIAHIAYTAGELDIRYAHIALALSESKKVRDFAALMIQDHAAVNVSAGALLKRLGATPQNNPTSKKLVMDAAKKRMELAGLTGRAFDRAYAKNELDYHRFVNKTLAGTLIPSTKNKDLKSLLKSGLATFRIHQGHAKMMVKHLK